MVELNSIRFEGSFLLHSLCMIYLCVNYWFCFGEGLGTEVCSDMIMYPLINLYKRPIIVIPLHKKWFMANKTFFHCRRRAPVSFLNNQRLSARYSQLLICHQLLPKWSFFFRMLCSCKSENIVSVGRDAALECYITKSQGYKVEAKTNFFVA